MASIKLNFRPSSRPEKMGALYFSVTHRRQTKALFIGHRIFPEEWNRQTAFIDVTGTPERRAQLRVMASQLEWIRKQITAIIAEYAHSMLEYDVEDIVASYRRLPPCPTWLVFIGQEHDRLVSLGRAGTAKTYHAAMANFREFRKDEDIAIDALDGDVMKRFERWMQAKGLKPNSCSRYLCTLRTLYRKAASQGYTTEKPIFRHVFTGIVKTGKRAISEEDIRKIQRLDLPQRSPVAFVRHLFLLIFFLQGISFIDLAYLKKSDIREGLLRYSRKKTGQVIAVRWEPVMQEIVDCYAAQTRQSPYLLPILTEGEGTERKRYERMERLVNYHLKQIGRMAGLKIPLTTYVARHSWASSMNKLTGNVQLVSQGLGHERLNTTQVYLANIDEGALAEANRQLINRVLENTCPCDSYSKTGNSWQNYKNILKYNLFRKKIFTEFPKSVKRLLICLTNRFSFALIKI